MSDSIKVAIRIRPLIQRERDADAGVMWSHDDKSIQQTNGTGKYASPYYFDRVFGMDHSTDVVFEEIANPIVDAAMQGFNGTIFAYGQTSSGKTYTMMGTKKEPGIVPQVVEGIYDAIENSPDREYLIRVSYLEIYNENVADLLSRDKKPLEVREDEGNVFVANLKEELVTSIPQILNLMKIGDASRHVGATNMNDKSSRSHSIFRLIIESRIRDQDGAVRVSHLNLVDLAGSEKAKATGATGQRLMEGGFINKSLFVLGNVISQLSDNAPFVNYRDSRLTRILQNSLGGNSKTAIICNISPAVQEETHSSLRFATSAKRIKNKPIQNEIMTDAALLQRYKKEITKLQKQLDETRNLRTSEVVEENAALQQRLAEKELLEAEQTSRIQRLMQLISVSSRIRPPTPEVSDFEVRRKRRETWCPGKAAAAAKAARGSSLVDSDVLPTTGSGDKKGSGSRRAMKSLPDFDEDSENESRVVKIRFDPVSEETSPESLCLPPVDLADQFSFDGLELVDMACQTSMMEVPDTAEAQISANLLVEKDEKIQELSEKLSSAEGLIVLKDEELERMKTVESRLNRTSVGGLELVHAQLEKLRTDLQEKERLLHQKEAETAHLEREQNKSVEFAEELLDEITHLKDVIREIQEEKDNMCIQVQELEIKMEKREEEFKEFEEFLTVEKEYKDDSIMAKQIGTDLVEELREKVRNLEKTSTDSQAIVMDQNKALSTMKTELEDLQQKLKDASKQVEQLSNEKADFGMYQELEQQKFKRRVTELTQQLEEAYQENSELRRQSEPPVQDCDVSLPAFAHAARPSDGGGRSLDMSLQAALAGSGPAGVVGNLEASMKAAEHVPEQVAELEEHIARLAEDAKRLQQEKEEVEKQIESQKVAMQQQREELEAAHLTERKGLQEDIERLTQLVDSLRAEVDKATALHEVNPASGIDEKSVEEQSQLEVQKQVLEEQARTLELEKSRLEEAVSVLETERLALEVKKNQIMEEKTALEENRHLDEERTIEHEEKLMELNKEKEVLTEEKNAVEELRKRLEEETLVLQEKEKELEVRIKEFEEKSNDEKLPEEDPSLVEERQRLDEMKETLEEEKKKFEDKVQSFVEEKMARSQETLDAEVQVDTEVNTEQDATDQYQLELASLREQIQELASQKTMIREELERVRSDLSARDADAEREDAILKLQEEVRCQRELVSKLREEKEQQEQVLSGLKEEQHTQEGAILNLKREKEAQEEELSLVKEEKEAQEELLGELKEEKDAQEEKLEALRELKRTQREQLTKLQEEKDLQEEMLSRLIVEKETLEEKLLIIERKGASQEEILSQVQEERHTLEEKLAKLMEERETENGDLDVARGEKELQDELLTTLREEKAQLEKELLCLSKEKTLQEKMMEKLKEEVEAEKLEEKTRLEEDFRQQIVAIRDEAMRQLELAKQEINNTDHDSHDATAADSRLESCKQEIERLQEVLKEQEMELEKQKSEVTSLKTSQDTLMEEKEEALKTNTHLNEDIETLKKGTEEIVNGLKEERDLAWSTIEKLREEIDKLSNQDSQEATAADSRLESCKQEIERLQKVLKEQEIELEKQKSEVTSLKTTKDTLMEEKEEALRTNAHLNEDIETLKKGTEEIVNGVKEERDLAWSTIDKLREEIDKLSNQDDLLSDLQQKVALHEEQVEELNECMMDQEVELQKGREQVTALETQIAELKAISPGITQEEYDTLKRESSEKVAALEEELDELRNSKSKIDDESAGSAAQVKELEEAIVKLKLEHESALRSIEKLKEQLQLQGNKDELEQKLSLYEEQVEQLNECINEQKVELEKERDQVGLLEDKVRELKAEVLSASDERDAAHKLIEECNTEIDQITEDKKEQEKQTAAKISQLNEELSQLRSKKSDVAAEEVKALQASLKGVTDERDEARRLIIDIDADIQQVREEKEKLQEDAALQISQLEDELKKLKSSKPGETTEIKRLEKCLEIVTEERDYARTVIDEVDAEIEQVKEEKKKLEKESATKIASLEDELKRLRAGKPGDTADIKRLKESLEVVTEERDYARKLIDDVDAEIEQVKEEKKKLEKESSAKMSSLEDQLKKLKSSKPGQPADVRRLEERLEIVTEERDYARKLIDDVDAEIEQVKEEKKKLEKESATKISSLEDQLKKLKSSKPGQPADVKHLEKCLEIVTEERDHARKLIDDVDAEIEQVKKEKKKLEKESAAKISSLEAEVKRFKETSTHGSDTSQSDRSLQTPLSEKQHLKRGHGSDDLQKLKEENLSLTMKLAEYEKQVAKDPRREKIKSLEAENKSLNERINDLKLELRRSQNQASATEASFVFHPCGGRAGDRVAGPIAGAGAGSLGSVGSVKLLVLESEKTAIEKELRQSKATVAKLKTAQETLTKKVAEQQKLIDKFRSLYQKNVSEKSSGDARALRGLTNDAGANLASPVRKSRKMDLGKVATTPTTAATRKGPTSVPSSVLAAPTPASDDGAATSIFKDFFSSSEVTAAGALSDGPKEGEQCAQQ